MSYRRKKKLPESAFPCKVVGWLNIWDVSSGHVERCIREGLQFRPIYEPYFCVLRQDLKTLRCFRSEHDMDDIPSLIRLPVVRLDDGRREFDHRWGYETLESIKENTVQNYNRVSSERLYKDKFESNFNESLPDLSRSYDSAYDLYPKRRHVFKKFFHTSYEKLVGDKDVRRGSVPTVPAAVDEDSVMMETVSTPSRFTNFLIRKGFKSNLKRTKSATKLDRKRAATSTPDPDSTFVGNLKRSMSLGRLTRKRTRSKTADLDRVHPRDPPLSVISSRLKNSQSHESLLTTNSPLHSIDLTTAEMEIKPLHRSILNQEHCFQVSTTNGSKYISCRTAEEREKWITNLRRTVQPQQENSRHSESCLKVWVQEAKNVPSKKRYYCEIFLDKTLYARTSIKTKGDMLFWGEHFEFNNLPAVEFLIVNLYREADKKKKKDRNTLVGYTKIPVADITDRKYLEKWFSTSSGTVGKGGKENKTDLPLMRLKVRHHTVEILPVDRYKPMGEYLRENYATLCDVLEPLVNVKDKEEIATTLVKIMQKLDKVKDFLSQVVMAEVLRLDNIHLTFRGNSIGTKAMEAHMKLVGAKYLSDTLGDFVRSIIDTEDDCEVDPSRVPLPTVLSQNQANLRMYCDMAWTKIISSASFFPRELRDVFGSFRERCQLENKDFSDHLISASIFLRFLCPAILSPSLFHLTQEFPTEKGARNLTLIAKTVQSLANFSKFGTKEEYMTFMNDFVDEEWDNMKHFLQKISTPDSSDTYLEFDGYIDLGKEMSILHELLTETLEKANEETIEKLGSLPKLLTQVTEDLKDPNINQMKVTNRKSQHYDNLVNIQAHIDTSASSTELLRDMLRNCGESSEDVTQTVPNGMSDRNGNSDSSHRGSLESKVTLSESEEYVSSTMSSTTSSKLSAQHTEVSNVSVSSRTISETHLNKSWNQMVSAADIVNGDYVDLISFMDEDTNNSSIEMEPNAIGSQMSISQVSTIASSGYQSFGYSQSSSPIDSNNHDISHDTPKSPNNNTVTHSTPLSFANPMYRHMNRGKSSQMKSASPIPQGSSNSSLSSEEANTIKNFSPVKAERGKGSSDQLLKIAPNLSSSSSSECVTADRLHHSLSSSNMCSSASVSGTYKGPRQSQSNNNVYSMCAEPSDLPRQSKSNNNVCSVSNYKESKLMSQSVHSSNPRKHVMDIRSSSPLLSQSAHSNSDTHYSQYSNTIGSTSRRTNELSQSVDFAYMSKKYSDSLRRTSTDTSLSQMNKSARNDNSSPVMLRSQQSGATSEDSSSLFRRLSAQNAVHMGIRSVQRRIHDQEKTKQEYEVEVNVLKQQLIEAQQRLKMAEERLQDHSFETHKLADDWQTRLEESEERMRKQQAEKDDQMKTIIQRLMHVETELRHEQEDMQKAVVQKQKVIEAQERRIQSLDLANNKLVVALNQLKDHYTATTRNGLNAPLKSKMSTDLGQFKTSSC